MAVIEQLPEDLKAPPAHFSPAAREFFLHVVATGSYDAPARSLLVTYCEVEDRIKDLRAYLAANGHTFTDKHGQPRERPQAKEYHTLINEKGKLFRLLGWDQAPSDGAQGAFFFLPPGGGRNAAR